MKTSIAYFLLLLGFLLASCGGDQKSSETSNQGAADGTYLGGLAQSHKSAVKTVDTAGINAAIQMFQVNEGRNPKDLNELVEKKLLPSLPTPPHGMKFDYDATAGTVKVVPQ